VPGRETPVYIGRRAFQPTGNPHVRTEHDLDSGPTRNCGARAAADERAHLAERILASLDGGSGFEQDRAGEIHRRLEAYEAGKADSIPGEEVFAEARRRLGR
jgi:putative addiction module component (TIGR02574 family)